eukprot:7379068-Prymnesium_polylepis.1
MALRRVSRLAVATMLLARGVNAVAFVGQRVAHAAALREGSLLAAQRRVMRPLCVASDEVAGMEEIEAKVRAQGELVKTLKTEGGDEAAVGEAVAALLALKTQLPPDHELNQGGRKAKKKKKAAPPPAAPPKFDPAVGPTMDEVVNVCKRRGFIFQSSEIYGGFAGFFDYGPLGVELRNNVKKAWWAHHIHRREDMVGLDSSIIGSPKTWKASGHLDGFSDPMVDCKESKLRYRADQLFWSRAEVCTRRESPPPKQRPTLAGPRAASSGTTLTRLR